MPSLMVFGKGHVTGIDLGANSFWRLMIAATSPTDMGLVVIYPPNSGVPLGANKLTLAKVEVRIAKDADEVERVARNALEMGTLDLDIARASESMNLFKMHSHVKEKDHEEALGNVLSLVRAYWALRAWLEGGADVPFQHEVNGWLIKAKP